MQCPEFNPKCAICLEDLFDNDGNAQNGSVSKLRCIHVVHTTCLTRSANALNSDGSRYGIGGFGPRCGCPLCGIPVSFVFSHDKVYEITAFWMPKIQKCLDQLGHDRQVKLSDIVKTLSQDDPAIKRMLQSKNAILGLKSACEEGGCFYVEEVIDGGPENGGSSTSYCTDGYWDNGKITDDVSTEGMEDDDDMTTCSRRAIVDSLRRAIRTISSSTGSFIGIVLIVLLSILYAAVQGVN